MIQALRISFILLILFRQPLTAQNLPYTHYKYQNTLRVCKQVALTFNDFRELPNLVMPRGKSNMLARFYAEPEMQLIIDEKLYDLCREIGKDSLSALAFVIGHELTHFFYGHQHPSFGFATSQSRLNNSNKDIEKEADLYGLIHGFSSGYQTFKVAKTILEKIYRVYELRDSSLNYPTKKQRINSIVGQIQRAQQLASTFEVGKFLYLNRQYGVAAHCFADLCTQLPTKEFLTNLGLAQLQQVLVSDWTKSHFMPFKLPVELEAENRLLDTNREGISDKSNESEKLLESSIKNFEKAIALDYHYLPAHINLATALLLHNRYGTVKDQLDLLEKNIKPFPPDAYLLRGIALLSPRLKDYEAAQADFDKANGAFEIEYNRKIAALLRNGVIDKENTDWIKNDLFTSSSIIRATPVGIEKNMGGLSFPLPESLSIGYKHYLPTPNLVHYEYSESNGLHMYKIQLEDSKFHVIQGYTQAPNLSTAQGIKIGDPIERVTNKYSSPSRKVLIGNGYFYCYDNAHIYFKIQNNTVAGWIIYQKTM